MFPFSVNWVIVDGIVYKKPCAVVIELGEDPVFAKLMGIYTTNFKDIYFDLMIFRTLEFDHHYHSYIVEPTSHTRTIKPTDLAFHLPHHISVTKNNWNIMCCPPTPFCYKLRLTLFCEFFHNSSVSHQLSAHELPRFVT